MATKTYMYERFIVKIHNFQKLNMTGQSGWSKNMFIWHIIS